MTQHNRNIVHLLNRAGFGPDAETVRQYQKLSIEEAVNQLFNESKDFQAFELIAADQFLIISGQRSKDFKIRRQEKRDKREAKQALNFEWLLLMAHHPAQLREKMALFWHDHFACNVKNPVLIQKQINMLRKHGLDYFGDLVVEIAKDPAMINYLNSKQNVKDHPNENFGRELLELFTIGIGNYSEKDIQEAARAFTGWRYDQDGKFYLDERKHDNGPKTFLNQKGNFRGEDIIDIVLSQPETGRYITAKLYSYLSGVQISEEYLNELSEYFYKSGYHITSLLKKILTSDKFYSDTIVGQKIKSPIELIVGIMRLTKANPNRGSFTYLTQGKLRQTLLEPPNVSGWPQGKSWVDLSTIPERLKLAQIMLGQSTAIQMKSAELTDEGDGPVIRSKDKKVKMKTKLFPLKRITRHRDSSRMIQNISELIFTSDISHLADLIKELASRVDSGELDYAELLTNLLSLPEYQLH